MTQLSDKFALRSSNAFHRVFLESATLLRLHPSGRDVDSQPKTSTQ